MVRRADGTAAYQLAVVVDDVAMRITEVVRGDDLLASTARQILLYRALGVEAPSFGHVPLLLGPDGVRLSKRHEGTSLRELRGAGFTTERVVGLLAMLLGLGSTNGETSTSVLVREFSLEALRAVPEGITIDPRSLRGMGSDITGVTPRTGQ